MAPPLPTVSPARRVVALVLAVAALAVLASVARVFRAMQMYARDAEPPALLQEVRRAASTAIGAGRPLRACGDRASAEAAAVGGAARAVADDPAFACLEAQLGWSPEAPRTRTGLWFEVEPREGRPGFAAHAVIDADGDGRFREYVATDGEAARLVGEAGEL